MGLNEPAASFCSNLAIWPNLANFGRKQLFLVKYTYLAESLPWPYTKVITKEQGTPIETKNHNWGQFLGLLVLKNGLWG